MLYQESMKLREGISVPYDNYFKFIISLQPCCEGYFYLAIAWPLAGGVLLEPAPTLKILSFQTVNAMTTKFSDFS